MNIARKAMTVFLTLLATPFFMREQTMNWLVGRVSTTATSDAVKTSRAVGSVKPKERETEFFLSDIDDMEDSIKRAFLEISLSSSGRPLIDTGLIAHLTMTTKEIFEDDFFTIVGYLEESNINLRNEIYYRLYSHKDFDLASRYLNVELVRKYPGVKNIREREEVASEINVLRYRALSELLKRPIVLHRFERGEEITRKWNPVIIKPYRIDKAEPLHIAVATYPTNKRSEYFLEAEDSATKDPLSDLIGANKCRYYYET